MVCRNCGTEIADKAIVCYRCGTGTKEPLRKPAEIRRRPTPMWAVVLVIVAILIALYLAWNYRAHFAIEILTVQAGTQPISVLINFPPGHA